MLGKLLHPPRIFFFLISGITRFHLHCGFSFCSKPIISLIPRRNQFCSDLKKKKKHVLLVLSPHSFSASTSKSFWADQLVSGKKIFCYHLHVTQFLPSSLLKFLRACTHSFIRFPPSFVHLQRAVCYAKWCTKQDAPLACRTYSLLGEAT